MKSVIGRINEIKQPRGGYIKPSDFKAVSIDDNITLNAVENIHSSVVGLVVDYLTRLIMGTDAADAFKISLKGAAIADKIGGVKNALSVALNLLKTIKGFDDESIINACKLVTFDVWYRNPAGAMTVKGYAETNPDKSTIENIQTLVKRSITFFEQYGPIIKDGFSFDPVNTDKKEYEKMIKSGKGTYGGYTATIYSGDGDFLTTDTLWDFKVSKSKPNNKNTLQLLMYWIMGKHSGQEVFKKITKLGIFNPRLNTVYILEISKVSEDIIKTVEREVICYE